MPDEVRDVLMELVFAAIEECAEDTEELDQLHAAWRYLEKT